MSTTTFYSDLKGGRRLKDILSEKKFADLPDDWHVVIADIVNSTDVVKEGRHTDVNLVAAGCVIACLNVAKSYRAEIPYFFGGDGGVVIVPPDMLMNILNGLRAHRLNSIKNFSLDISLGNMPVSAIKQEGFVIKIAKTLVAPGYHKAVLVGNGLKYAEQMIKQHYKIQHLHMNDSNDAVDLSSLNLEGLECRWNAIKPPSKGQEVVCLLIEATDPARHAEVYSQVLLKMEEIYGADTQRNPLSVDRLMLVTSFRKFHNEMRARYSKWNLPYLLKILIESFAGKLYFRFNLKARGIRGNDYLSQVVAFADTLTIDGRINTIISGRSENRKAFLDYLQEQEDKGIILFGHFVSSESVMTCYIEDMYNRHTHFVDGAGGGYTNAALELKPKLRQIQVAGK